MIMYRIKHPHIESVKCSDESNCWMGQEQLTRFMEACGRAGLLPIEVLECVDTVEAYQSLFG